MFKRRSGSLSCAGLGSGKTTPNIDSNKKEIQITLTPPTTEQSSDLAEDLKEAKRITANLRQRTRAQAQQILQLKRALKMQEIMMARIHHEKHEQMKFLSGKLLLFQSRLVKKQKEISSMLQLRENIIHRQKIIIENLTSRLADNGLEVPPPEMTEVDTTLPDLESLNDSDSAVVIEDIDCDSIFSFPKSRSSKDGVTVMRSISDAIDPYLKYTSLRRNNGFLRRPEILETVYSVEEDVDESPTHEPDKEAKEKRDAFATKGKSTCHVAEEEEEKNQKDEDKESVIEEQEVEEDKNKTNQVKTYNRVMSNHRSVTKPKDVKYKRINKAKSKSLEELRGRLKNWVEHGSKLSGIALEQSQSCA